MVTLNLDNSCFGELFTVEVALRRKLKDSKELLKELDNIGINHGRNIIEGHIKNAESILKQIKKIKDDA